MNLRIHIDAEDPTPPYEQLRRQLTGLITSGALSPDTRLPAVRQLASDLGLAAGTVARSYSELEKAGLVMSRRGAGTRVTGAPPAAQKVSQQHALHTLAADVVERARALGVEPAALRTAVDAAIDAGYR